jgi:hypothetical protein
MHFNTTAYTFCPRYPLLFGWSEWCKSFRGKKRTAPAELSSVRQWDQENSLFEMDTDGKLQQVRLDQDGRKPMGAMTGEEVKWLRRAKTMDFVLQARRYKWRKLARRIDAIASLVIPAVYYISFAIQLKRNKVY